MRLDAALLTKEFNYELGTNRELLGNQRQFTDKANGHSSCMHAPPKTRLFDLHQILSNLPLLSLLLTQPSVKR
jgi:hypothetical protein